MTAAMPAVLDYPFAGPPAPGETIAVAPAARVAAHAVAVRARSHQSLAARRRRRLHARRLRLRGLGDARAVAAAFRHNARGQADPAHHRDALPSRSHRERRVACEPLRRAGGDDPRGIPDGARNRRRAQRPRGRRDDRALPPPRHDERAHDGARGARQPVPPWRAGAAADVRSAARRRSRRRGRRVVADPRGPWPFARARVSPLVRAAHC